MSEGRQLEIRKKIYLEAIEFYRKHPDCFCEEVLDIRLNLYQKVLMRAFFTFSFCCFCLGRGLGKTWLGVLCISCYALLYPNQKIGIIAPAFRQGKNAIQEKFHDELCNMSPFLEQEVETYVCSTQKAKITFYNGSWIEAYPVGTDGSKIRGARLNVILVDEAAYVPKYIIENVVKPMAIVKSGYRVGEDDDSKGNKILMCSTPYYRFNHLYPMYLDYLKHMAEPDNTKYFACILDYEMGLHVGLFDEPIVEQQRAVMSRMDFEMEYEAQFPKISDKAWIKYDDLILCSDLDHVETHQMGDFEYVMSIDVARVKGNDNTIIDVFKLHWGKDHAEADLVYMESMNGVKFEDQAKRVRDVLKKFPNTIRIYQDTMTIGQGLSDELAKDYFDAEEQKWMPPLIDMNNEQAMSNMELSKGVPIIYGIRASAEINHRLGMAVKVFTEKKWLHMYPFNVSEKIDLNKEETRLLAESEETRSEVLNIETVGTTGGWLQFDTISKRKDRWSALGMGLFGIQILMEERLDELDNGCVMPLIHRR